MTRDLSQSIQQGQSIKFHVAYQKQSRNKSSHKPSMTLSINGYLVNFILKICLVKSAE